ncbi:MAG TPA: hypothetical protein VIX89_04410 [Bryobacteraceae bacterium]
MNTRTTDQFNNPAKTRPHVSREGFQFISNAGVEQFDDPRHSFLVLHFCNTNFNVSISGSQAPE